MPDRQQGTALSDGPPRAVLIAAVVAVAAAVAVLVISGCGRGRRHEQPLPFPPCRRRRPTAADARR